MDPVTPGASNSSVDRRTRPRVPVSLASLVLPSRYIHNIFTGRSMRILETGARLSSESPEPHRILRPFGCVESSGLDRLFVETLPNEPRRVSSERARHGHFSDS